MKLFKIRNITTGLYSKGGTFGPYFDEEGKTWKKINHVTAHITMATNRGLRDCYNDCEIVEFEYNPVEINSIPIIDLVEKKAEEQHEREQRYKEAQEVREYRTAKAVVERYERADA